MLFCAHNVQMMLTNVISISFNLTLTLCRLISLIMLGSMSRDFQNRPQSETLMGHPANANISVDMSDMLSDFAKKYLSARYCLSNWSHYSFLQLIHLVLTLQPTYCGDSLFY